MSVQATSYVWEHSQHKGPELLLLLAIANIADTRGFAYPGVPRLARDIRMSERTTQRAIHACEASGELEVRRGAGPHGTNLYWIKMNVTLPLFGDGGGDNLTPDNLAGRQPGKKVVTKDAPGGDTALAHEPTESTTNRKDLRAGRASAPVDKKTNPTWYAYAEEMKGKYGIDLNRNAKINGQLAQIVARCGAEDAPRLIRFVFQRKNDFYERLKFSLGIIVKDLDGLIVEMKQAEKRKPEQEQWWLDDRKIMERATREGIERREGDTFAMITARLFVKLGDGPWMHKMTPLVQKYVMQYSQKQPA